MELEELKKSWNTLDEHLKERKLVNEEDISRLIRHAGTGISAIARLNAKLILISLPVIFLFLASVLIDGQFDLLYLPILIGTIPALCWDVYTVRFIRQTQIDEMPLVEVINRINRIRRWIINEQFAGIGFILLMATISFVHWQVWQLGWAMLLVFILVWGCGIGLIVWCYRYKFMNRIREIKKNLDELKELRNE